MCVWFTRAAGYKNLSVIVVTSWKTIDLLVHASPSDDGSSYINHYLLGLPSHSTVMIPAQAPPLI
jgi:hypothetical protein